MLAVLDGCGIRFVSSWARNAAGVNPTPLSVQPFWYAEQGFPDLLEIPFQHWLDGTWFEEFGIDRGVEFAAVLGEAIDEIVRDDLVYGACFHDWAVLSANEEGTGWISGFLAYAQERGVEVTTYTEYWRRVTGG
jgi:hypothetical protein